MKPFTLQEIANWTTPDSKVKIPAIQRGLVWKPRQVEMLWDSILRGFPIGSFMLSDISKNSNDFEQYYLMDGQQRFNAISLGYDQTEEPNAVLWIDIDPHTLDGINTTRRFLIRTTTSAHPWGFAKDESCTPLNTDDRRRALDAFNLDGSIFNIDFSLKATWPIKASKPIPLQFLTTASIESKETFIKDIETKISQSDYALMKRLELSEEDKKYIKETLYGVFVDVAQYEVHCNHLSLKVLNEETKKDVTDKSDLEILFERINVNGTRISNEDLAYSSIKAYWPDIRDKNDEIAKHYMAPAKLAVLAFRLCLTEIWADKLHDNISIKQIRNLAGDENQRLSVSELYNSDKLSHILKLVDNWIGISYNDDLRTPSILRTLIAHKQPELYLMLMFWAKLSIEEPDAFRLNTEEIRAITFTIRWWSNKPNEVIKEIMSRTQQSHAVDIETVKQALASSMHDCNLLHIYNPIEVRNFFEVGTSSKWTPYTQECGPWREFFWRLKSDYWNDCAGEMLLYAERQYINTHFANYAPARHDMWESYNRPWDYDHIVAQNRITGKQGEYREYDKFWLNTIGNIAAISYESNRSKNDSNSDYHEYDENKQSLLFDNAVKELKDYNITYYPEQSYLYAKTSFSRLVKIYERIYHLIEPAVVNIIPTPTISERKDLYEYIMALLPSAKAYLVAGNQIEYEIKRMQDWCREWISVGVVIESYYACICWDARKDINKKKINFEIGIRKAPGTTINQEQREKLKTIADLNEYDLTANDWWYAYHLIKEENTREELVERLTNLVSICKTLNTKKPA